jgi:hypothetical protein
MSTDSEVYRNALEIRTILAKEIVQFAKQEWLIANREYGRGDRSYYEGQMDALEGIIRMTSYLVGLTYEPLDGIIVP